MPMEVLLFVQLNEVATGLVNRMAAVKVFLQTVWLATGFAVGTGFTVTEKSIGATEVQPLNKAVA